MGRLALGDATIIIGVVQFARMFEKSRKWAREKFMYWLREQERGGPQRVWKVDDKRGARLYTTLAVVQQDMPRTRDPVIMRKLNEHDRDLDTMARRIDDLTTQLHQLRRQLAPKSGIRITA
jgi:hypothetical protein